MPLEAFLNQIPSYKTCYESMQKLRRAHLPANPKELSEIVLSGMEEELKLATGECMLLADNGADAANRIILFGFQRGLEILHEGKEW